MYYSSEPTDNQDEELYDDVSTVIQQPPSLPSRPAKLPPVPSIELPPIPGTIVYTLYLYHFSIKATWVSYLKRVPLNDP